jgi:hypothetical protein
MQQFASPCLLQHFSTCIFLCCKTFFSLFDFFKKLILFFVSLICFFVCRNCVSPSLCCGRSHDDLILLHLCWCWNNFSNFSSMLNIHVWLHGALPFHYTTNIMMTYMYCHETSLPLHPMIPIASILLHPVFLIVLNSSSHSHIVYFINHELFFHHLYLHRVLIHPISNVCVFFVLVVVVYT